MKSFRRILIPILILALLLPVLCMTGSAGSGKTIAQLFPIDDGLVVVLYADGTVRASDPALNRKVSSWQHVSQLQYVMPTGEPVVLAGLLDSGEVVCTDPYIPSWRNVSKLYL